MIRKRRITASSVSTAFLCSGTGASRHVVSYIDGADHHPQALSVSTNNSLCPFPSRILVHSFGGLFEVEAQLDLGRERILFSAVSEYGVLACRVRSLPPEKLFAIDFENVEYSVEKVIFFSGRQRLAEVTLKNESGIHASPNATVGSYEGRYPMQCLYAADLRVHVAVFVMGPDTVCACTPQACKEQRMQFDDHTIACMGVGREGEAEVSIILDDHTVALCGVRAWVPTASEPTAAVAGDLPRPPAQFFILKTGILPELLGTPRPAPIRVFWSGRLSMWVVYEDGSICVFSCQDTDIEDSSERNGIQKDVGASEDIKFTLTYSGRLSCMDDVSGSIEDLFLFTESRVLSLCYCYARQDKSMMHYGSFQLHCHREAGGAGKTDLIKKSHVIPFGETVYGLHVEGGRYHVLTQTRKGDSPLYITTLPFAECDRAGAAPLYQQIAHAPEDDLGEHCRTCEARIAAICQADVNTFQNSETTTSMLAQLTELQHSVYVLLRREQLSTDQKISSNHSYPQRILCQLSHAFMEVSVNLFLSRLDVLHGIDRPLHECLGLYSARAVATDAQQALMEIVNAAFPSLSTSESPQIELWLSRVSLCMDVILEHLGYSSKTSLMVILREATEMSPMLALLVLYYSYKSDLYDEDNDLRDVSTAAPEHQRHANALREEFLITRCNLPASLNTWAFACYAVDHGINPLEKSHSGVPLYMLGPRVPHLNSSPILTLLPALVNGLLNVAALDAAYQQTAAILGLFSCTSLSPILSLKLSFGALKIHAYRILEAIYRANQHTVSEEVSIRALALAALQLADVTPLRGLIRVGSVQERVVERVLCSCRDVTRRNWVRLCFYILMRRYADTLQVCRDFTSQDTVADQPTQVILSYIRSLMPAGNEHYMSEYLQHSFSVPSLHFLSNEEEEEQGLRRVNGTAVNKGNKAMCMSMVPTSLENQPDELDAQVRCAMVRCTSHSNRRMPRFPGPHTSSRSNITVGTTLRPSRILSSLDQNGNNLFTAPNNNNQLEIDKEDEEETISKDNKCSVSYSAIQSQQSKDCPMSSEHNVQKQKQNKHNNESASEMLKTSLGGFGDVVLCEARLQRSGKMCSRVRPCPYHDRKGC